MLFCSRKIRDWGKSDEEIEAARKAKLEGLGTRGRCRAAREDGRNVPKKRKLKAG